MPGQNFSLWQCCFTNLLICWGFTNLLIKVSSYMMVNLRTVEPSLIPTTVGPQRHYRALCLWIPWRKLYPALLYSERAQRCQIFYRMHYDFSFIPLNFLKFPYPWLACFLWTFTIGWQIFIQKYNVNINLSYNILSAAMKLISNWKIYEIKIKYSRLTKSSQAPSIGTSPITECTTLLNPKILALIKNRTQDIKCYWGSSNH